MQGFARETRCPRPARSQSGPKQDRALSRCRSVGAAIRVRNPTVAKPHGGHHAYRLRHRAAAFGQLDQHRAQGGRARLHRALSDTHAGVRGAVDAGVPRRPDAPQRCRHRHAVAQDLDAGVLPRCAARRRRHQRRYFRARRAHARDPALRKSLRWLGRGRVPVSAARKGRGRYAEDEGRQSLHRRRDQGTRTGAADIRTGPRRRARSRASSNRTAPTFSPIRSPISGRTRPSSCRSSIRKP